jgi:hypothetical protein
MNPFPAPLTLGFPIRSDGTETPLPRTILGDFLNTVTIDLAAATLTLALQRGDTERHGLLNSEGRGPELIPDADGTAH